MNVYFGKMNNPAEYAEHVCNGSEEYFNGIAQGDYAFIRLAGGQSNVRTLWKFSRYDEAAGRGVFDPICDFIPLPIEKFLRMDVLNFDKNVILTTRPSKTRGFFRLNLIPENQSRFEGLISEGSLGQYVSDPESFRKIVYEENPDALTGDPEKDVLIGLVDGAYKILNENKSFLADFASNFNPNRYEELARYLLALPGTRKCASHRKAKKWLDSKGGQEVTLSNLWDLFCSRGPALGHDSSPEDEDGEELEGADEDLTDATEKTWDPKNLIIYGIPGCGKSYRLKNRYLKDFAEDKIIRTTFHSEYSNCDFVGQVRPTKKGTGLDYQVVAGPFTKALCLALKEQKDSDSDPDAVALVIEEINRGNAAAIFGDLFQLLDRDSGEDSEYEITNETIASYLGQEGIIKDTEVNEYKIKIPSNLYLFATMNTSDQNVFKLDTAFKRRWEFERLTNADTRGDVADFTVFKLKDGAEIKWLEFIDAVNKVIVENEDISGDRQIGNFFYKDTGIDLKRFANKVLEYLYNDVCKYGGKEEIFKTDKYKSFDDIYNAFVAGENVFRDELFGTAPAPAGQINGNAPVGTTTQEDDKQ